MKVRQDAWTDEDDLLLAETVLRHVRRKYAIKCI